MTESEIRMTLSKIKVINKRFVSYYYSQAINYDNGISSFKEIHESYVSSIRDAVGGPVNKVQSKRILKAIGFENYEGDKYLIPVNGLDLIEIGTKIKSILNEEVIIGKDNISKDSRNGMLAYYIELPNLKR